MNPNDESSGRYATGPINVRATLLKNELTAKVGVKNKRLSAALDEDYLTKVLLGA